MSISSWLGKKAGGGAVDGALAKLGQKLAGIDPEKFMFVSNNLTPEQADEFHKNLALLVAYGVKAAAKALEKQSNG